MRVNLQLLLMLNQQNINMLLHCRNKVRLFKKFLKKNTAEENKVVLSELVATCHGVVHHHSYASQDCGNKFLSKLCPDSSTASIMWTHQSNELRSLVFVQKFKFILMKMHKNCYHQSCSFWLRYAARHQIVCRLRLRPRPYTGGVYSAPPDSLAGLGGRAPRGKGRTEERGK